MVILSAAHLDHDTQNPEPRLAALCQSCHLKHDGILHGRNSQRTRGRNKYQSKKDAGQLELFND